MDTLDQKKNVEVKYYPISLEQGERERAVVKPMSLLDAVREFGKLYPKIKRDLLLKKIEIYVNGDRIPPEKWHLAVLEPGDYLQIVTAIGTGAELIAVGAIITAVGAKVTVLSFLVPIGVGMMMSGAMSLIMGPPNIAIPSTTSDGTASEDPVYRWDGRQIQYGTGGRIPVVYGETRVSPQVIVQYIDTDGEKSYLNMLLCLGWGEIEGIMKQDGTGVCESLGDIPDILINDQPLGNFRSIEWDWRPGTYTQTVMDYFDKVYLYETWGARIVYQESGDDFFTYETPQTQEVEEVWVHLLIPYLYQIKTGEADPVPLKLTWKVYYQEWDEGLNDWDPTMNLWYDYCTWDKDYTNINMVVIEGGATVKGKISGDRWDENIKDEFEDGDVWGKDVSGNYSINYSTEDYVSYNHSYKISFPASTFGVSGEYGKIGNSLRFGSDVKGIRLNFRGKATESGKHFIQLFVGGTLVAERDLYECSDIWDNYIEDLSQDYANNTKSIIVGITLKDSVADHPVNVYIDNLQVYIKGVSVGWQTSGGSQQIAQGSGKYYWELGINNIDLTDPNSISVGIGRRGISVSDFVGNGSGFEGESFGYRSNGYIYHNGTSTFIGDDYTYTSGDIIGICYDSDSGKLWFRKNGAWLGGGNPDTGSGANYTGLVGSWAPAVSIYDYGSITGDFGPDFDDPPSGFEALAKEEFVVHKASKNPIRKIIRIGALEENRYKITIERVTKSHDAGFRKFSDLRVEGFTLVQYDEIAYRGVALLGIRAMATDQLSGGTPRIIPKIRGKKVLVPKLLDGDGNIQSYDDCFWDPNNEKWRYGIVGDPEIREEVTHSIDGGEYEYVTQWTRCPIWQAHDMLLGKEYGLGRHISVENVDRNEALEQARYCKELVQNSYGVWETRFLSDIQISKPQNGREAIGMILSACRGMAFEVEDSIRLLIDKPEDYTFVFNSSNIKEGSFKVAFIPRSELPNALEVSWDNPQANYTLDRIKLISDSEREKGKPQKLDSVQFNGITRYSQVIRDGWFVLLGAMYRSKTISFDSAINAVHCAPGNVVLVQEDMAGWGKGGRVVRATNQSVVIDNPKELKSGKSYGIIILHRNGDMETRNITNSPGTYTELNVDSPWDAQPVGYEIWLCGEKGGEGKLFRITSITRKNINEVSISALEYNPTIYGHFSAAGRVEIPDELPDVHALPGPVENLQLIEETDCVGFTVSFSPPTVGGMIDPAFYQAVVQRSTDQNNWMTEPPLKRGPSQYSVRWCNLTPHETYYVKIWAENKYGASGDPVTDQITLREDSVPPGVVTGLEIEGQGNNTTFLCRDVVFVWNEVSPWHGLEDLGDERLDDRSSTVIRYEVKMYVNEEEVGVYKDIADTRFEYTYEMNVSDNNGVPQPEFTIKVWAIDEIGNRSPYPAELTVNNAPPPSITGLHYNFDGRNLIIGWVATHNPCDHLRYELSINGVLVDLVQSETALTYTYPWEQNVSDNRLVVEGTNTEQKDFHLVDSTKNFNDLNVTAGMRIGNKDSIGWADIKTVVSDHELELTYYYKGANDQIEEGQINLFENPDAGERYQIGGYPDPTINISIVDVDVYWQRSETPTEITAVNNPPAAPTEIFATPMTNSVNFVWPKSLEDDVDAYLYRYKIENESWEPWVLITNTNVTIALSSEMREKYSVDATIHLQVRAKDIFYQLSAITTESDDALSIDEQQFAGEIFKFIASDGYINIATGEEVEERNSENNPVVGGYDIIELYDGRYVEMGDFKGIVYDAIPEEQERWIDYLYPVEHVFSGVILWVDNSPTVDLTLWNEEDDNNRITPDIDSMEISGMTREEDARLYKDYGNDKFNSSFRYIIKVERDSPVSSPNAAYCVLAMFSKDLKDPKTIDDDGDDCIQVFYEDIPDWDSGVVKLVYREMGFLREQYLFVSISTNEDYWLHLVRTGTQDSPGVLRLEIYEEEEADVKLDYAEITLDSMVAWRYITLGSSYNDGTSGTDFTGRISSVGINTDVAQAYVAYSRKTDGTGWKFLKSSGEEVPKLIEAETRQQARDNPVSLYDGPEGNKFLWEPHRQARRVRVYIKSNQAVQVLEYKPNTLVLADEVIAHCLSAITTNLGEVTIGTLGRGTTIGETSTENVERRANEAVQPHSEDPESSGVVVNLATRQITHINTDGVQIRNTSNVARTEMNSLGIQSYDKYDQWRLFICNGHVLAQDFYAFGTAGKWEIDERGLHGGGDDSDYLEDPTKTWQDDQWEGLTICNIDDCSKGEITSNNACCIIASLAGGDENKWDLDDRYCILDEQQPKPVSLQNCDYTYMEKGRIVYHDGGFNKDFPYLNKICAGTAKTCTTIILEGWHEDPSVAVGINQVKTYAAGDPSIEYVIGACFNPGLPKNRYVDEGQHSTVDGYHTLIDSSKNWVHDTFVGRNLCNVTTGAHGVIRANTGTCITASMYDGVPDDNWYIGNCYCIYGPMPSFDSYEVLEVGRGDNPVQSPFLKDTAKSWEIDEHVGHRICNITDESKGIIYCNNDQCICVDLCGGNDNYWDTYDEYVIECFYGKMFTVYGYMMVAEGILPMWGFYENAEGHYVAGRGPEKCINYLDAEGNCNCVWTQPNANTEGVTVRLDLLKYGYGACNKPHPWCAGCICFGICYTLCDNSCSGYEGPFEYQQSTNPECISEKAPVDIDIQFPVAGCWYMYIDVIDTGYWAEGGEREPETDEARYCGFDLLVCFVIGSSIVRACYEHYERLGKFVKLFWTCCENIPDLIPPNTTLKSNRYEYERCDGWCSEYTWHGYRCGKIMFQDSLPGSPICTYDFDTHYDSGHWHWYSECLTTEEFSFPVSTICGSIELNGAPHYMKSIHCLNDVERISTYYCYEEAWDCTHIYFCGLQNCLSAQASLDKDACVNWMALAAR